ncbi:dead box ATP-dependent rna helicase [Tuber brumale]|nr:dead box ATP-dependent rna helicase [Tuber brumale]
MGVDLEDTPEAQRRLVKPSKEERKASRKAAKEAKKKAKKEADGEPNGDASPSSPSSDAPAPPVTYSTPSGPPTVSSGYTENLELTSLSKSTIDEFLTKHAIAITDPRNSNLRPITSFSYLPSNSFDFTGFTSPTPIQAATWPFTLSGHDCIGVAETGSGKTLAFAVPAIRHIIALKARQKSSKGVRVVVVSPTRELAMQIYDSMEKYSKEARLSAVCVYGGVPKDEQRAKLKRADIVVATPGRLNDLIDEGSADLSNVSYLVLDEADRMLDKGFEEDIKRIIRAIPSPTRQTLMFTATWPQSVRKLASAFMASPAKITIGGRDDLRANVRISQTVEVIDQHAKESRLVALLKQHQSDSQRDDRILVFCLYKKEATRVENFLRSRGLRVAGIHGDLSQVQRTQALAQFKDGKCPLLIATDVAARGLDIPKVKLVINVTFPLTIEDYVHRIGRTGRAGADGMAYTFFTEHDKPHSGALVNVLKAAGQPVPEALLKFGTTVKKKEHAAYGAFYRETDGTQISKKIKFDD